MEQDCAECGPNKGWIYHQAPMKAQGVIGCVTPCKTCNADGAKPDPLSNANMTISFSGPFPLAHPEDTDEP